MNKSLQETLREHNFRGQMTDDEKTILWSWQDLFGADRLDNDVWAYEVGIVIAGEMHGMATNPDYQHGLMLAVEVVGQATPEGEHEAPWWFWWSAKEAHRLAEEHSDPKLPIMQRAVEEAASIYKIFSQWPEQKHLALHIARETPKIKPVFV